jgi:hypothetical protein
MKSLPWYLNEKNILLLQHMYSGEEFDALKLIDSGLMPPTAGGIPEMIRDNYLILNKNGPWAYRITFKGQMLAASKGFVPKRATSTGPENDDT